MTHRHRVKAEALLAWLERMEYAPSGEHAGAPLPSVTDLLPLFQGAGVALWPFISSNVVASNTLHELVLNLRLQERINETPDAASARRTALRKARTRRAALTEELAVLEERTANKLREAAELEMKLRGSASAAALERERRDDLRTRIALLRAYEAAAQRRRDATLRRASDVRAQQRVLRPPSSATVDEAAWWDAAIASATRRVASRNAGAAVSAAPTRRSDIDLAAPPPRVKMKALFAATDAATQALRRRTASIDIAADIALLLRDPILPKETKEAAAPVRTMGVHLHHLRTEHLALFRDAEKLMNDAHDDGAAALTGADPTSLATRLHALRAEVAGERAAWDELLSQEEMLRSATGEGERKRKELVATQRSLRDFEEDADARQTHIQELIKCNQTLLRMVLSKGVAVERAMAAACDPETMGSSSLEALREVAQQQRGRSLETIDSFRFAPLAVAVARSESMAGQLARPHAGLAATLDRVGWSWWREASGLPALLRANAEKRAPLSAYAAELGKRTPCASLRSLRKQAAAHTRGFAACRAAASASDVALEASFATLRDTLPATLREWRDHPAQQYVRDPL